VATQRPSGLKTVTVTLARWAWKLVASW